MRIATLAALTAASSYPDGSLVDRFMRGFQITGDIPECGIYPHKATPSVVHMDQLNNEDWFMQAH